MGQTQGGAAGVENEKSIFLFSAVICLVDTVNERQLTAKPTFIFILATSGVDPKQAHITLVS